MHPKSVYRMYLDSVYLNCESWEITDVRLSKMLIIAVTIENLESCIKIKHGCLSHKTNRMINDEKCVPEFFYFSYANIFFNLLADVLKILQFRKIVVHVIHYDVLPAFHAKRLHCALVQLKAFFKNS